MSTPYSPYGQQGGGGYGAPGGGQYGTPNDGQYGAPNDGSYGGAPNDGQYGRSYGAPSGGQYGAPSGGQYGAPGGGPYDAYSGGQYGQPGNGPYGSQYGQPGGPYGAPGGYAPPGYPRQQGYLQGAPVDFQSAIRLQIENVTNFQGRASQSAYWWYALALFVVNMVLEIFSISIGSVALSLLIDLVIIAVGFSGLSVGVRRLHDTDRSGWMLLLGLIPFIGWIVVIVLLALPGTPGQNRFG